MLSQITLLAVLLLLSGFFSSSETALFSISRAKAKHLADFADGAARTIADHGSDEACALPAVTLVNVLDHFLAPLMLEIDVDIRRLAALA